MVPDAALILWPCSVCSGASDWSKACTTIQSYKGRAAVAAEDDRQHESKSDGCSLFSGRWVYDNRSYPLYEELDCPYMSDQLACRKHGRPDRDYQSWRWQPDSCELKRWNATEMLEKLRGKRLMFVGDSLNRGQWISMVCLVQSAIPAGKKSMTPNAGLTKFMAEEYNASIEFYWAPLIVESNSDDPINHRLDERKIRPDSLLKHAAEWANADILIFNSYLWWRSGNKIKLLWSSEEDICEEADGIDAMKLALETWAGWVSTSVDPQKQQVFFVTMSPTHLWRGNLVTETMIASSDLIEFHCFPTFQEQGMESGQRRKLLRRENADRRRGLLGSGSDVETMHAVAAIMAKLGRKITVLNITQLSEYRKDGHPSIYRKFWETLTPRQLANPASYADCIHWCLPGVPDVWNELLFNLL
uniref:Uncharacterized protein n=1 Tax=Ananas comosus var. bracteatus TaxID=296719 RepID=A0A6V7PQG9_ANACO|nr:unnamed protein product [Ananas comosus var. bracteatus]